MTYTIDADSYSGTDDAKLAAAFTAVRNLVNTNNVGARLVIAPRLWQVSASVNARGIARDATWVIDAEGAVLSGTCTGKPILDLVGSQGFACRSSLTIIDGRDRHAHAVAISKMEADGGIFRCGRLRP
jgi:hypothetical protein